MSRKCGTRKKACRVFIWCRALPLRGNPELAHQIGLEFADRLLGGHFQAVVSTHLNTKCIHNHIVWNSVSMKTGRKYRSNERTYVTRGAKDFR